MVVQLLAMVSRAIFLMVFGPRIIIALVSEVAAGVMSREIDIMSRCRLSSA